MFDYIIPIYFFAAFSIGILIAYLSTPTPEIIIKYPTPENAGKIIYKDNADVCYKYKVNEVSCPADKSKIKNIDIQQSAKEEDNKSIFSAFMN